MAKNMNNQLVVFILNPELTLLKGEKKSYFPGPGIIDVLL